MLDVPSGLNPISYFAVVFAGMLWATLHDPIVLVAMAISVAVGFAERHVLIPVLLAVATTAAVAAMNLGLWQRMGDGIAAHVASVWLLHTILICLAYGIVRLFKAAGRVNGGPLSG